MLAKYPITEKLRVYARTIQASRLNYGIEKFSRIIGGHAKSWGSNLLAEEPRTKDMAFEDIWSLFMIDYNYKKFINNKARMSELIADGVARGILKDGMTFEKMFPGNKPPEEIFTMQKCPVPSKSAAVDNSALYKNLFSDDNFSEEEAYVSVNYININTLTKSQLEDVENFIVNYIESEFDELSGIGLKNEYWLFAFYLMCKTIEISPTLWERIKIICYDDEYMQNNDKFKWRHIYETVLAENKTIRNPTYYTKPNIVYFDNQDAEISSTNFPIFNIRYDFNEMKSTMGENNYEIKLENCVHSKIKLADLFLILYRGNYLEAKVKNKALIFQETCKELLYFGIEVPFYKFDFIDKPEVQEEIYSLEAFDLTLSIRKWLGKNILSNEEYRKLVEILTENLKWGNIKFLNLIALDFTFISKLSDNKVKVLKDELEKAVTDYKKKNIR